MLTATFTFWPWPLPSDPPSEWQHQPQRIPVRMFPRYNDGKSWTHGQMSRSFIYHNLKKTGAREKFCSFPIHSLIDLHQFVSNAVSELSRWWRCFLYPVYRQNLINTQRTLGITLRFPVCKNTDECFICWLDVLFNFTLEKMQTSCLDQQRAVFTNTLQPMRHFIHEVLPQNKRQALI